MGRAAVSALAVLLVVLLMAWPVEAGPWDKIRNRIGELQKRIDKGIASGELTREEAAKVQSALDKIRKDLNKAVGRPRVKPAKRKNLIDRTDRLGLEIDALRRNDAVSTTPPPKLPSKGKLFDRISKCQKKIDHGRESGALTLAEEIEVQGILNGIRKDVGIRERYGYLTPQEISAMNKRLDALEEKIKALKKNPERRKRP
jgi:polyhydroxyalkanoate synthesis regulator phasin